MATEISNGKQTVKLYHSVNRGKAMYQLAFYTAGRRIQKNFEDKSDAYIGGEVSRLQMYDVDPNDYIEVSAIDPQGKVLSSIRTDYFPKPVRHRSSRSGNQFSSYVVKIHFIPPAFSTIKVVYVRLD